MFFMADQITFGKIDFSRINWLFGSPRIIEILAGVAIADIGDQTTDQIDIVGHEPALHVAAEDIAQQPTVMPSWKFPSIVAMTS